MLMMLSVWDAAPIEPPLADKLSIARGAAAARRPGCGACHAIPGIDWPKGRVGPPLAGLVDRALVAGRFPKHLPLPPDFLRAAPYLVPGRGMPAAPLPAPPPPQTPAQP